MGKPAARVGDMHVCPMVTPGVPPIPHVGGPITGPGVPTVLIGGMPAATLGDMCTCVGPPDTILLGSMGVFIGGKPAARMGDTCAHGGTIMIGMPTVLIGEAGGGAAAAVSVLPVNVILEIMKDLPPATHAEWAQVLERKQAAESGTPFIQGPGLCPVCGQEHHPGEQHADEGGGAGARAPADPAPQAAPPTATITSQTVATSPVDRTRTRIGVGEEVRLNYSLGDAAWSKTGGGELSSDNGSQVTFTASDAAESVTITATGGGATATITFNVVTPDGWHMYKKSGTNLQHTNNKPDCGFFSTVYLHPNDVNFYRVEVREQDSQAVSTGAYNNGKFANQWHGGYALPDRVSEWLAANNHTEKYGTSIGGHDHVYSGYPGTTAVGAAPPFVVSTKEYPIVWQWHVVGKRHVTDLPHKQQHHDIASDGTCTSSKAGYSAHALYSDPTSAP